MKHSQWPRWPSTAGVFLAAIAAAACGDGLLQPNQVPTDVRFEEPVVTVTAGDPVDLRPFVVDQVGERIRLPLWSEFDWSSSQTAIFDPMTGRTGEPGLAYATAHISGLSGRATVRVNPTALDVRIPHAYLVQAVQRRDGTVPLVAGRDATLRLFATGDGVNFFQPEAEATFFVGDEVVGSRRVTLTQGGVIPTAVNQGVFESSWAVDLPGSWIRPGLAFVVTLDPDQTVPFFDRAGARFPGQGRQAVEVIEVPEMQIRFVPVHQERFGSTGNIDAGSASVWTAFLEEVFPIAGISRDVRSPFHTHAATATNQTDWYRVIQEIWALRLLDDDDRYYYGVLTGHGGSIAGLGYVGFPVSIGFDNMATMAHDPIPLAFTVFAHEIGHNFGRFHSPGCGAGNPDPNYPYGGGIIGVYGLHRPENEIKPPQHPDLMGYCWPMWVSDYTFEGVLDFRTRLEAERRRYGFEDAHRSGLLVWGSIVDGEVRLEPAISLERAAPTPPATEGPLVEGLDERGRVVFSQRAEAMRLSHAPDGTVTFAAVIPLTESEQDRLASLRVAGAGVPQTTCRGRFAAAPGEARALAAGRAAAFAARAVNRGRTRIEWDQERYPLLVVREADTGEVVAFARTGEFILPGPAERMRFDLSDGVRSVRARPVAR
jgi:hypothetical protein